MGSESSELKSPLILFATLFCVPLLAGYKWFRISRKSLRGGIVASRYCCRIPLSFPTSRWLIESGEPRVVDRGHFIKRLGTRLPMIHAYASSHAICFELGSVNFCFKWRHRDGSIIEFSQSGWFSDDFIIADWLSKMNQLYSSTPAISPAIRNWLQEECELIEITPPDSSSD
jgi:hypothetical protein